jgi:hypothetical protein
MTVSSAGRPFFADDVNVSSHSECDTSLFTRKQTKLAPPPTVVRTTIQENNMNPKPRRFVLASVVVLALAWSPGTASAHCDTLNGPVVAAARLALQKGDVTPVLRWVKAADEAEIRHAFEQTLVVRTAGPEAKELADRYFFETLVRVHRQGEGAPYTGLKAGTDVDPAVEAADKAIENGSVERATQLVTGDIAAGIRRRFARVVEARKHADESVAAGREFVEAYVEYVHYVENLHLIATGQADGHAEGAQAAGAGGHSHK